MRRGASPRAAVDLDQLLAVRVIESRVEMKIVTTTAFRQGFGNAASNPARIRDACQVLDEAAEEGARIVLLPAGFLCAPEGWQLRVGAKIVAHAEKRRVAVVFGVDTSAAKQTKRPSKRDETNRHWPFFIVACGTSGAHQLWRQRSTSRANGAEVDEHPERRVVDVDGELVDVLACGEVFSAVLRAACKTWGTRRMVVPFHTAAGSRFSNALSWSEQNGICCVRAVHANEAELGARSVKHLRDTEALRVWTAVL